MREEGGLGGGEGDNWGLEQYQSGSTWDRYASRTVCESRRSTLMAEGSDIILEMYVSTALVTSISAPNVHDAWVMFGPASDVQCSVPTRWSGLLAKVHIT